MHISWDCLLPRTGNNNNLRQQNDLLLHSVRNICNVGATLFYLGPKVSNSILPVIPQTRITSIKFWKRLGCVNLRKCCMIPSNPSMFNYVLLITLRGLPEAVSYLLVSTVLILLLLLLLFIFWHRLAQCLYFYYCIDIDSNMLHIFNSNTYILISEQPSSPNLGAWRYFNPLLVFPN